MHESCSCLSCARTKQQKAKVTKTSSHKFNNCRSVLALRFWQMRMWVTVVSWQAAMDQRIHSFEQQLLESRFVTNRLWRVMRVRERNCTYIASVCFRWDISMYTVPDYLRRWERSWGEVSTGVPGQSTPNSMNQWEIFEGGKKLLRLVLHVTIA